MARHRYRRQTFHDFIVVGLLGECWEWLGPLAENGYGRYGHDYAHRLSYLDFHGGPIPDGYVVHHTCRNRSCVNPHHLELHTPESHPDAGGQLRSQRTHCRYGHPFDEQNTHYRADGSRYCRACGRDRTARRKKEAAGAQV